MPDVNKFDKLRAMDYNICNCCSLCANSNFPVYGSHYGTCKANKYEHLKHDNPAGGREVSIHRLGSCPQFELDPALSARLGSFMEFITP